MTVSLQNPNSIESPAPAVPRAHRKPEADVYTILLVLALIAVLVAVLFLYLFMKAYDFKADPPAVALAAHLPATAVAWLSGL
jgi:hypothetical protein